MDERSKSTPQNAQPKITDNALKENQHHCLFLMINYSCLDMI